MGTSQSFIFGYLFGFMYHTLKVGENVCLALFFFYLFLKGKNKQIQRQIWVEITFLLVVTNTALNDLHRDLC